MVSSVKPCVGDWLPGVDPIPASLAEMLAYFRVSS